MKTNDTLEIFNEETYLADVKEEVAMCISHKKIPYPLPENLRLIHTAYEAGDWQFPAALVPKYKLQRLVSMETFISVKIQLPLDGSFLTKR